MRRSLALFAALATLGCAPYSAPAGRIEYKSPGRYVETLSSGGLERKYILRIPKQFDGKSPMPVVVVLHGWTSDAASAEAYTRMGDESDKEGFIAVFPEGLGGKGFLGWNAGFIDLSGQKQDDVAYISGLLDKVQTEVAVDPKRIYIAGHSNGAFLANYAASKLSKRIAAFASVAGTVGTPLSKNDVKNIPDPVAPVSALLIHGKQDPMVWYGEQVKALLMGVSAHDSAKWWSDRDGCSASPKTTTSSDGNVITDIYSGGKAGTEVELVSIVNGMHDWPGGITRNGDETKTGVNAADLIWAFFKAHPKGN